MEDWCIVLWMMPGVVATRRGQHRPPRGRPLTWAQIGYITAYVLMLASTYVRVEPAPYDVLIVLVLAAAVLFGRRIAGTNRSYSVVWAGLFLMANLVSIAFSQATEEALRYFGITVYLIVTWAVGASLVRCHGAPLVRHIVRGYVIAACLTACYGVLVYVGGLPDTMLVVPKGRLQGFFKDPNVFGAFLVPPALAAMVQFGAAQKRYVLLWILAAVACVAGILVSYSRGAWVNLVAAMLLLITLRLRANRRGRFAFRTPWGVLFGLGLCFGVFWALYRVPEISELLGVRLQRQAYDDDRFGAQSVALEMALAYPLGIGPGQSEQMLNMSTHSLYVRALVENGIFGLASLVLLLGGSFVRSLRAALNSVLPDDRRLHSLVAASLFGIGVESAVIDTIHWRHMFVLLVLAATPLGGVNRERTRRVVVRPTANGSFDEEARPHG